MIYFDNAATTKIYDDALTSYVQVSQKFFGNPSSLHQLGVDAFQVLTKARAQVASYQFNLRRFSSPQAELNRITGRLKEQL